MAFFVVQRDADSALSIPLSSAYATREEAISALSAATAAGSVTLTGEVFIADLGTAVPVLVMQAAPALTAEAPQPDSDEVPADLDERAADDLYAPPLLGDEQSLAAALKRATTSLEEEGIVAPESISSEEMADLPSSEARPWEWANVEAYEPPVEQSAELTLEEPEAESEPAEEPPAVVELEDEGVAEAVLETESVDEPILEAEIDDAPAEALAQEAAPILDPDIESLILPELEPRPDSAGLEVAPAAEVAAPLGATDFAQEVEPEVAALIEKDADSPESESDFVVPADESPILTSAPLEGEDAYIPRPVILGDYADAEPSVEEAAPESPDVPEPSFSTAAEPAVGVAFGETGEGAYAATGALDLGGYTCQDCVYANTCPKVGQATPADCGSFQWRSE